LFNNEFTSSSKVSWIRKKIELFLIPINYAGMIRGIGIADEFG